MNKLPWTVLVFPITRSQTNTVPSIVRYCKPFELSIVVVIIVEVQIKFGTAACSGSAPVSL